MKQVSRLLVPILLCLMVPVRAQDGERALIYPEHLREDLEVFRQALHAAHPDPYRYVTRAALDRTIDSLSRSITVPLAHERFAAAIQPLLHRLGDPNTVLEDPGVDRDWYRQQVLLLPLEVRVCEEVLVLEDELKGFGSIPPGSSILAIDGLPVGEVLGRMRAGIVSRGCGSGYADRMIEERFPELYDRFVGRDPQHDIRYRTPDGEEHTTRIASLTLEEMDRSMRPLEADVLTPWHYVHHDDLATTWLRLETFDQDRLRAAGIRTDRFLDELNTHLRDREVEVLVIDVRGAAGRELHMAEEVFSRFAEESFRVVQGMSVRSMSPPKGFVKSADSEAYYASVNAQYLPDRNEVYLLRPDDPRLEPMDPVRKAFGGKVYIVQDGGTREAGAALSILAGRSGRARLVGEATGTNALAYCGGRTLDVKAPASGLVLRMPLVRYLWDGAPRGEVDDGEPPHHPAHQEVSAVARGRDSVRDNLLQLIRELR